MLSTETPLWRKGIAGLVTAMLIAAASIFIIPATSYGADADGSASAVVNDANDGLSIRIQGEGLPSGVAAAYVAVIERGTVEDVIESNTYVAMKASAPVTSGVLDITLTAAASDLDRDTEYQVLVWKQHSNPTPENIYFEADIDVSEDQWDALFGPEDDEDPAPVADPQVTVSPSTPLDPAVENTLTVEGTGFVGDGAASGAYVALGEKSVWDGTGAFPAPPNWIAVQWVRAEAIVDGAFSVELTVPADALDPEVEYIVATSAAHQLSVTDRSLDTITDIAVEEPDDGGGTEVPVWEPEFEVFLADGVTPYTNQPVFSGDTLVIRGSGFDPEGNVGGRGVPIPNTLPQGTYLVFGHFAEVWQPSNPDTPARGAREPGAQQWLLTEDVLNQIPEQYRGTVQNQWAELNEDGTFETRLVIQGPPSTVADGEYGIYTYGAGGVSNADQEIGKAINYVGSPSIEVFLADGVTPYVDQELELGDELIVRGQNFGPNANVGGRGVPIPNTLSQGAYVVFGHFTEKWHPSKADASAVRKIGSQGWVLPESVVDQIPPNFQQTVRDQWVPLNADGSFEARLEVAVPFQRGTTTPDLAEGGRFGVYTYGAGGVNNGDQELEALVSFVYEDEDDDTDPTDPDPTDPDPTDPGDPDPVCDLRGFDNGSLDWGVKQSFRNYITGNIAKGSVSLIGDVTQAPNNGPFTFSRILGHWDEDTDTGSVVFAGAIKFNGHGGLMDLTYANPTIEVTSATEGKLILDVRGTSYNNAGASLDADRIVFAEFTPTVTRNGDTLSVSGTNVAITEAGSVALDGFYPVGDVIDDFTLSATLGDLADCDTDVPGIPDPDDTPKVEFTVDGRNTSTLKPGDKVSVSASGFQPGESVLVTVHSEVIQVGNFRVSADGTFGFDWTVPFSISEGAHRMVLVGSETGSFEYQFTVAVAATGGEDDDDTTTPPAEEEPQCVARAVNGGTLSWGVKSSFRDYINGPIAKGSISTSGVSQSGSQFNWGGGSGAFNTDAHRGRVSFSGSVQFSGHSGLLDLRISNPRIQITGPNSAQLIADVVSKGYNGSPDVNSRGVTMANLRLSGGQVTGNQVRYTNVPATLTGAGAQAFVGFYNAGDALDSVSFTLPLGAEIECDAATGTLASTGAGGDRIILVGATLLFLGVGLVASRRKFTAAPVAVKARM